MKRVQFLHTWLVMAVFALSGMASLGQLLAADAPWYVDNIVKTSSDALGAEATADGSYLQLEIKVEPGVANVPWHKFKVVDVKGEEVGELSSRNEEKGILVFEGDWSKVVGLYLEGMNHKQELFPNAVVEDIPKAPVVERPLVPVVDRPVVNTVVDRPVVRTEEVRYTEPDRRVVIHDRDRVVRHDTVRHVYDNDRHDTTVIHHDGHDDHVVHDGHDDHVDHVASDDHVHVEGCNCGHCDGHGHAHGGDGHGGHGHGGDGSGSGSGTGCALCGGAGCAECGGSGSPWEMDSFAKKCGQGDTLAMGSASGHSFAADSAFGEGKGTGAGPGSGPGMGSGPGEGPGAAPGEGTGPGPGEGTGPGPGEGTGPGPGEGEGPCPDEGEGPAPGEKPAAGPGPGPGDAEDNPEDYGPEPPEMNPMNPNFRNGNGAGGAGANMISPNYKNMAPRIQPRVHNLAKNFLPDPPVIEGPEIYVFNPQIPYWNPQMPYYQPGFGYGYGGGGGYGYGGGGGYGYLPEDAMEAIAPPKMEEGMVLYISTGGPNTEGKIFQVNEHGRVLGMVNLPFTATGIALHKDNGLVCVSPRDGGKVYRIDDSAKVTTVLENDENVVSPSDVAVGYNTDTMVLADNLAKTLSLSNVAGMTPVKDQKLQGGKYDQPEISVAMARDKSVLFSTSDQEGVYMYNAASKNPTKVLDKTGAVAASTATMLWAATQGGKDIVVMEGDQPQRTFTIPQKNVYRDGMLSFGPRESVVVAAKDATSDEKPWLIQFSVDDEGKEQIRNLFQWNNAADGEMVDFVVGPRMYWERNERKTMKSVY